MRHFYYGLLCCLLAPACFAQDIVSGGDNAWIFHTPDDRTALYIAPYLNGTWEWSRQTVFINNGDVHFSGSVASNGKGFFADNVGIGTLAPASRLQVNSTNNGTGYTDWIAGNFGGTAGHRVVTGIMKGVSTIGGHNYSLTAWADLAINPEGEM